MTFDYQGHVFVFLNKKFPIGISTLFG